MPWTRANLDALLADRRGAWMAEAELAVTPTPPAVTLPALDWPVTLALLDLGVPAASFPPGDQDLAGVADVMLGRLADTADVRLLEMILGNMADFDVRSLDSDERFSQVRASVEKELADRRAWLTRTYGGPARVGQAVAGSVEYPLPLPILSYGPTYYAPRRWPYAGWLPPPGPYGCEGLPEAGWPALL